MTADIKELREQLWFVCRCGRKLSKAEQGSKAQQVFVKCPKCKRVCELRKLY